MSKIEIIETLNGKCFYLNNDRIVIKKRKHGLQEKPPLYTWNVSKSCYVSSLIPTNQKNIFKFDIRYKHQVYRLILNDDESICTELLA